MLEEASQQRSNTDTSKPPFLKTPPSISLPKGGGAIRGVGEKFATNPVTGTAQLNVPLNISSGRSGFAPQLSLSYDSGAGNGPFGLGWSLSLPSITRKTDRGLPRYEDEIESDVFILSGAEDLVPVGSAFDDDTQTYSIQRYQPRIEGHFARIERWSNKNDDGDVSWRSISRENITTWYGKTPESRIVDPVATNRIFSWLICTTYDDKGNEILYEYAPEDDTNVDQSRISEHNRSRTANRYLRRVKYGNTPSRLAPDFETTVQWHFEVLFDYDDGNYREDAPDADGNTYAYVKSTGSLSWSARSDPYSSYRAGFEVRTHRLCQRILMFHRFDELLSGEQQLVRSTEIHYQSDPIAARVFSVSHCSFVPGSNGTNAAGERRYFKKSLPPLDFQYSEPIIDGTIRDIDPESLENLPYGLNENYQWVDLDGEGLSGILTEQDDGWFYKRNLAPINLEEDGDGTERARAKFAPVELVASKPNVSIANGEARFMDLAGDGQLDLVLFGHAAGGFYERDGEQSWETFRAFSSQLNRSTRDSNLRFVDLDGDGHADVLITEDEALTWHSSLGEDGFGVAQRVVKSHDEEVGPALLFADGTQSIYLADMCGDGLTDLVRIRNGEVCYWPNLGYGRFGAKVTMDNAPLFEDQDQFEQRRVRLADVDGSGVIDIVYLHAEGARIYFNHAGNGWSNARRIPGLPRPENLSDISVIDLLGNGTACLVWSSPLTDNARRPMKYIDLMSGQKPHLLIGVSNNLGALSRIEYTPSTRFYLQDQIAGNPWITRLPFPVQCVSKVTVEDKWKNTRFTTTYSYHHGYFDGVEREFRGFGRVEQVDTEDYGTFQQGNIDSPYITNDQTLYQPPVKTISWFHTGAALDRERILTQFRAEYFPQRFAERLPDPEQFPAAFVECVLPEPEISDQLSVDEWREAMRACKGMLLRQEVYELDIDDLKSQPSLETPVRLFAATVRNCQIELLQARGSNRHAIFLVTESEAIDYHYELALPKSHSPLTPDPRISHTLNLKTDKYGNVLESIAAVYVRRVVDDDQSLTTDQLDLLHRVQNEELHLMLNCTDYTKDVFQEPTYRLPVPCQTISWEITGLTPSTNYFSLGELRSLDLSGAGAAEIPYHQTPDETTAQKRVVECVRSLFFGDDLQDHLDFGLQGKLSLQYESYQLALTKALIDRVLVDAGRLTAAYAALDQQLLGYPVSGYYKGDLLFPTHPITITPVSEQYWIASGRAGFSADAALHFYLPERYTDSFGNTTTVSYDTKYDLFIQSSADARENTTQVDRFDYRLLGPSEVIDINGNHTEVYFDVHGLVIALATKGKQIDGKWEGDNLDDFNDALANLLTDDVVSFCSSPTFNEAQARAWLADASTRFVYHFGERVDANGAIVWNDRMAGVCAIMRERHVPEVTADPLHEDRLQVSLECSDGTGSVLMKKLQAEPDPISSQSRWIVNGLTVINNKNHPVKQYEPAFSDRFGCELPQANGVCSVTYYDALGRVIRVEMPDGTFSRVEFSPWQVARYDGNDTAYDSDPTKCSDWYKRRTDSNHPRFSEFDNPRDRRAAQLVQLHADTPAVSHFDSLGRSVLNFAHNKYVDRQGVLHDEKYVTFMKLDTESKPLWIRDARGNLVMQYITPIKPTRAVDEVDPASVEKVPVDSVPCYDIAGNLLCQHSMDAGDRWMLMDAVGKPMLAWDRNDRQVGTALALEDRRYLTKYDSLHRPIEQWIEIDGSTQYLLERFEYHDTVDSDAGGTTLLNNLRGMLVRHYDPSGLSEVVRVDFNGNIEEVHRTLLNDYKAAIIDWQGTGTALAAKLVDETFVQIKKHDALGRVRLLYNWHRNVTNSRVAVYVPRYNERGLLVSETIDVRATKTATGHDPSGNPVTPAIVEVRYNAKGQKTYLKLGNGTVTRHTYDPESFRMRSLYTLRGAGFTSDCGDEPPPPRTPAPDVDLPPRSCGVQNLHYTYDPVGNITHIQDDAQQTIYFQNARVDPSNDYSYDAIYRLVIASGREEAQLNDPPSHVEPLPVAAQFPVTGQTLRPYTQYYQYDSVGNTERIEHVANTNGRWTRFYEYANDSNRLLKTWHGDPDWNSNNAKDKTTYAFDTHGNMLNLAAVGPSQYLQWDHRDMIATLNLIGGGNAYYNYDSSKQRTRKRVDKQNNANGYWERIYFGSYELYRRYAGPNSTTLVEEIEWHHVFESKQRVLLVDDVIRTNRTHTDGTKFNTGSILRYQYPNHLGSAVLELDDQAEIISYEEYHPYGTSSYRAKKNDVEVSSQRYRYTGMERDDESGLNYHTARYYLPWLTRWLSCDPTPLNNLYLFANDNPILWKDTNGRAPTCQGFAGCDLTWEQRLIAFRRSFQMDWHDLEAAKALEEWKDAHREENYEAATIEAEAESQKGPSKLRRILDFDLSFGLAAKELEFESEVFEYVKNVPIGKSIRELISTIVRGEESVKETAGDVGGQVLTTTFGPIADVQKQRGAQTTVSSQKLGKDIGEFTYEGGKTVVIIAATIITPEMEAAGAVEGAVTVEKTAQMYRATDRTVEGIKAVGYFRENTLELMIRTKLKTGERGVLRGSQSFRSMIEHFGLENIEAIKGSWSYEDNLKEFNRLISLGKSEEEAALGTWTGQQAKSVGFGKATIQRLYGEPGSYEKVEVLFTRE